MTRIAHLPDLKFAHPASNSNDINVCELLLIVVQDFVVSARLVQAYHASFSQQMTSHMLDHHQPEMDRGALTAADVTAAGQLLQTAAVTRLSVTLVYYLYTK